jgi:hypothetical protein
MCYFNLVHKVPGWELWPLAPKCECPNPQPQGDLLYRRPYHISLSQPGIIIKIIVYSVPLFFILYVHGNFIRRRRTLLVRRNRSRRQPLPFKAAASSKIGVTLGLAVCIAL